MCRAWMKLTLKFETSQWISLKSFLRKNQWITVCWYWELRSDYNKIVRSTKMVSNLLKFHTNYSLLHQFQICPNLKPSIPPIEDLKKSNTNILVTRTSFSQEPLVNWTKLGKISLRTGFEVLQIEALALYKRLSEIIIK